MSPRASDLRILSRIALGVALAVALLGGGAWTALRLGVGPEQTFVAPVRYKLADFGEGDLLRDALEGVLGNERLWLDSPDPAWIYVPRRVFRECWSGMRPGATQTCVITFAVRKLALGGGHTPARNIKVETVEGRPAIAK